MDFLVAVVTEQQHILALVAHFVKPCPRQDVVHLHPIKFKMLAAMRTDAMLCVVHLASHLANLHYLMLMSGMVA